MIENNGADKTAQQRFDETYISSSEICATLGVSRTTINYARKKRMLPEPITISPIQVCLWERKTVEAFVTAWRAARAARGVLGAIAA